MPKKTEVNITLPDALGKRMEKFMDWKHPFQHRRGELKRDFALNAISEKLDREEAMIAWTEPPKLKLSEVEKGEQHGT